MEAIATLDKIEATSDANDFDDRNLEIQLLYGHE